LKIKCGSRRCWSKWNFEIFKFTKELSNDEFELLVAAEDDDESVEGRTNSGKFINESVCTSASVVFKVFVTVLEQVRLIGSGGTGLTLSCSPLRVFD
jgi:hypothetical protein